MPHAPRNAAVLRALAAAALLALAPAACKPRADQSTTPATLEVGLVFDVGGRGDKSFNDSAYEGLVRAQNELGVRFVTLESGEGADREAALRQLAAGKAQLIFGVGFLFSDDIRALAQEFPDKRFACIDYTVKPDDTLPPNLVAVKFQEETGSFLVGALAGLITKTNIVGFVGGMQIPLIKKFEAGYTAGVRHVNPQARVIVKYAGTTGNAFKDPTKGRELALAEYDQGADIIYHASGSTGLGVFEAARSRGKFAIGVDSDQYDEAPGHVLTSMVKRVDVAVLEITRATIENRWTSGVRTLGLAEGGVTWVYDERNRAQITDAVKDRVEALKGEILAGKIIVPTQ